MKIHAIIIVFCVFLWHAPDLICRASWPHYEIVRELRKKVAKCELISDICSSFLARIRYPRELIHLMVFHLIPPISLCVIDKHLAKFVQLHEHNHARLKKQTTTLGQDQSTTSEQSEIETRFDTSTTSVELTVYSDDKPPMDSTLKPARNFENARRSIKKTRILRRILLVSLITEAPSVLTNHVRILIDTFGSGNDYKQTLEHIVVPDLNFVMALSMEIGVAVGNFLNLPILYTMDKKFRRKMGATFSLTRH